jgi:Ser/Thr protein kinase RdoA (MazF antagonist)
MPFTHAISKLAHSQASRWLGEFPSSVQEQTGGLSGARVWRVESSRGTFALRQYPVEFPTEERLRWLHRFLKEVQDRGFTLLPCPVSNRDGATWIEHESQHWELLTWVHGEPLLETHPSRELLIRAAAALAKLHAHTEQLPYLPLDQPREILRGCGRGLLDREKLLSNWQKQDEVKVEQLLDQKRFSSKLRRLFQLQKAAFQRHDVVFRKVLQQTLKVQDRLIPVLRDVQPGHVIFNGNAVAGFVDVTATRVDSAMGDLARLLHRWRYVEPTWYAAAIAAYQEIRPLPESELVVLDAYDYSARLLTGIQWLNWIVLEEREFANQTLVEQHWVRIERDLLQLLDSNWSKTAESSVLLPSKWGV